jgi:hypothetical protein
MGGRLDREWVLPQRLLASDEFRQGQATSFAGDDGDEGRRVAAQIGGNINTLEMFVPPDGSLPGGYPGEGPRKCLACVMRDGKEELGKRQDVAGAERGCDSSRPKVAEESKRRVELGRGKTKPHFAESTRGVRFGFRVAFWFRRSQNAAVIAVTRRTKGDVVEN